MATLIWTLGTFNFLTNDAEPATLGLNKGWRVNPVIIPLKQGAFANSSPRRNPLPLNLTGRMSAEDATSLRTKVDSLTATLEDGRQELNVFNDRYINVIPQAWQLEYIRHSGLLVVDFTIDLLADDAAWVSETLDSSSYTTTATPAVSNGGNISIPIKLTITAPGGGLTAFTAENTTTNKSLSWARTLLAGEILVIDMDTMDITEAGNSTLGGFSGVFWELDPGSNSLNFTSTPTGATVSLEKRDRWG